MKESAQQNKFATEFGCIFIIIIQINLHINIYIFNSVGFMYFRYRLIYSNIMRELHRLYLNGQNIS